MTARDTLSRCPLFEKLNTQQISGLAKVGSRRRYQSGESVFVEGEECEGLFVIAQGTVKLIKTVSSGRQIVLATETAPNSVAEVPVFDGGPYPATVVAVEDTSVLLIPRQELLLFCQTNPDVALKMLEIFGARLRRLVGLVEGVTFGSVRQRLAQALLEAMTDTDEGSFAMPGTHEELAQKLGTVREVVSRNLGRFQAEGFIRSERKRITILNAAELRREAQTEL